MMQIQPSISKEQIKSFSGAATFAKGMQYYAAHRVERLVHDPVRNRYDALVRGTRRYKVYAVIDEASRKVNAGCDCPAYEGASLCKHIVAALLLIEELYGSTARTLQRVKERRSGRDARSRAAVQPKQKSAPPAISEQDIQLARTVLRLFEQGAEQQARRETPALPKTGVQETVSLEYAIHLKSGYRSEATIELKIGTGRLYVVQKIKDFLDKLEGGIPYSFTKLFTFDPLLHRPQPDDERTLGMLLHIFQGEQLYRSRIYGYYSTGAMSERSLFVPPSFWEPLLESLKGAAVQYDVDGQAAEWEREKELADALFFSLNAGPVPGSYRIDLRVFERLRLIPQYGAAALGSKLYRISERQAARLEQLRTKLASAGELIVPPEQVEGFMRRVVPQLKKLGRLEIAPGLAEFIVSEPLHAKVFVDRNGETMTARVEFHYGAHCFDPLEASANVQSSAGERVIMRQPEQEDEVLRLLAQTGFRERGNVFVLKGEEAVYAFLYRGLEQLQETAEVFATQAVQAVRADSRLRPRATVDVQGETNWLEVRFELPGVDEKELAKLLRSVIEKKTYHRLSDGRFLTLENEAFREIEHLMEELGLRKSELKDGMARISVARGLSLEENERSFVRLGKRLRTMLDHLRHPDHGEFEPPAAVASVLRDYQRYGFQWMSTLAEYGFGGVLADDMGLGKTLQSISYLLTATERRQRSAAANNGDVRQSGPALIVCPASLIYNWKNELAKFAPALRAVVAAGTKSEREAVLGETEEVDVLITSYPLLRRDLEWYGAQSFDTLVLDEAQAIKNAATQTAQAVKAIRARQRFALTGTPVENRLEELWSIFDAVFPELFTGRKSFSDLAAEQVARKIRPFLLRRLKKDVLTELPDKIETLQTSELMPEQKKLYMAYLMQLQQESAEQLAAEGFQKSRMKILAGLTRLRQICCHPSLFVESYKGGSGKLEQFMELTEEFMQAGRRMLVFSQFTSMLDLLRREAAGKGWRCFYLDGATKPAERVELCSRFNAGEAEVFFISLKAGGTGLNLTGADTVLLYDLWWNPAVEQQAADRAHRIGQKNVVQVIRLITEGTIEEKMVELQQRKKDLIDSVIEPGEEALAALTEEDIRELLSI